MLPCELWEKHEGQGGFFRAALDTVGITLVVFGHPYSRRDHQNSVAG